MINLSQPSRSVENHADKNKKFNSTQNFPNNENKFTLGNTHEANYFIVIYVDRFGRLQW